MYLKVFTHTNNQNSLFSPFSVACIKCSILNEKLYIYTFIYLFMLSFLKKTKEEKIYSPLSPTTPIVHFRIILLIQNPNTFSKWF
jgi:hypothetical protein